MEFDDKEEVYSRLCEACRSGDLEEVQRHVLVTSFSAPINRIDNFQNFPLYLACLCGHYAVVKYLLENGASCDRDTFEGERCLYGALTDEIRDLLIAYNFTKSIDETQPFAAALSRLYDGSLYADIIFRIHFPFSDDLEGFEDFPAHRFILSARSRWFRENLQTRWRNSKHVKLARNLIYPSTFRTILRYLYTRELEMETTTPTFLDNLFMLCRKMELSDLATRLNDRLALSGGERAKHRKEVGRDKDELTRVQEQLKQFVINTLLDHVVDLETVQGDNNDYMVEIKEQPDVMPDVYLLSMNGKLFPAHRAMLAMRSEYFSTMFTGPFMEGYTDVDNINDHEEKLMQIIRVGISDEVLRKVIEFIYTDKCDIASELAYSVLVCADMLLLDRLKSIASIVITSRKDPCHDIYDLIRTAWTMKNDRIEQFCCKWFAYHLEDILDDLRFHDLVKESASAIKARQETDTIELIDDIRYYLSLRYGIMLEDLFDENGDEKVPPDQTMQLNRRLRTGNDFRATDDFAPLTSFEIEYNRQLTHIDELLEKLSLAA